MKAKQPCAGVKRRDCRYTEDEFVKHNPGLRNRYGVDGTHQIYRRDVAAGLIPPTCPDCGFAHPPLAPIPKTPRKRAVAER